MIGISVERFLDNYITIGYNMQEKNKKNIG